MKGLEFKVIDALNEALRVPRTPLGCLQLDGVMDHSGSISLSQYVDLGRVFVSDFAGFVSRAPPDRKKARTYCR